jgi:hypothetical protein
MCMVGEHIVGNMLNVPQENLYVIFLLINLKEIHELYEQLI